MYTIPQCYKVNLSERQKNLARETTKAIGSKVKDNVKGSHQ